MHRDGNGVDFVPLPLRDRRKDAVDQPVPGPRQAQMRSPGTDRPGRQRDPVEYEVRRAGQQRLILLAGRLALHPVRDHHGRPSVSRRPRAS